MFSRPYRTVCLTHFTFLKSTDIVCHEMVTHYESSIELTSSFRLVRKTELEPQTGILLLFTVTLRVCPQEQNFLAVNSTPAVETYNLA